MGDDIDPAKGDASRARELMSGFSLEITAKDAEQVAPARTLIPSRTQVNLTFLGRETQQQRVEAAQAILAAGMTPMPHIAARRQPSHEALQAYLKALQSAGASGSLLVVGGDPSTPEGPFADALSVIQTGVLPRYGARTVAVSGYPEGHPDISAETLWSSLEAKVAAIQEQGLSTEVITQFGFDADAVIHWIEGVRERGITAPVRVGVPGPAGVGRLMKYAARFGISTTAGIAKKYGLSLTNLLGSAGPDRFIDSLAGQLGAEHGRVAVHFYTFGGVLATAEWIHERYGKRQGGESDA